MRDDTTRQRTLTFLETLKDWPGTLIAVSKYATVNQMLTAYEAGIRHFGENKVFDALEKQSVFRVPVNWHLIGHLQSNKVNKAVGAFTLIHSIDSISLAEKISRQASILAINQPILLQVNISKESQKTGFSAEDCVRDIVPMATLPGLTIKGLMTVAPDTRNSSALRSVFIALKALRDQCEDLLQQPLPELSMGMSNDFEHAIACGATIIRVGSRLFNLAPT